MAVSFKTKIVNILLLFLLSRRRRRNKNKINRRWWIRPYNRKRNKFGFENSFMEIKKNDPESFFIYTRMSCKQYDDLLDFIYDDLKKTSCRPSLSPNCRLAITLL